MVLTLKAILDIAKYIEDTIDMIDEVAIMMNMLSIGSIREPAKEIMNLITKVCAVLVSATVEF